MVFFHVSTFILQLHTAGGYDLLFQIYANRNAIDGDFAGLGCQHFATCPSAVSQKLPLTFQGIGECLMRGIDQNQSSGAVLGFIEGGKSVGTKGTGSKA